MAAHDEQIGQRTGHEEMTPAQTAGRSPDQLSTGTTKVACDTLEEIAQPLHQRRWPERTITCCDRGKDDTAAVGPTSAVGRENACGDSCFAAALCVNLLHDRGRPAE